MQKVYSNEHLHMAGHIKNLLEQNGIACFLRNQNLSGGIGELPLAECWPEVWVEDARDYSRAMFVIEAVSVAEYDEQTTWICRCGEENTGQFLSCWNCESDRPEDTCV